MKGLKTELAVGIFVLVVFAVLAYMTFKVSGIEWGKAKGYRLYATFKNVAGLDEKTKIKIAGVDAGVIEKISLVDGTARLTLRINPDIKLYSDAEAAVRASGLLGDKYLFLKAGSAGPLLKDGDEITKVAEVGDIEDLFRNFAKVSENINNLIGSITNTLSDTELKDAVKQTVTNLRDITVDLKATVSDNKGKFSSMLSRLDSLTASLGNLVTTNEGRITNTVSNLDEFTGALRKDGPALMANLSNSMAELRDMIAENRPTLTAMTNKADHAMASLSNITAGIERGEGTMGKLMKDEKLYASLTNTVDGVGKALTSITRFRTFLTFQGDYLFDQKDGKGSFYLTLQPREDKYYIIGVTSDPVGSVEIVDTTIDGTAIRETTVETRLEFTAQYAKRFGNAALRAGLTENTFGLGADYFLLEDKLKVSVDAWDFGKDELDAKNPHVKAGADYFIFKHVFVSAGMDNLFNDKRRGVYAGGGVRFEDEDFKYIFGSVPNIPGK